MAQVTWYSARDLVCVFLVFHKANVIESSFELRPEVPRGKKQCSDPSFLIAMCACGPPLFEKPAILPVAIHP